MRKQLFVALICSIPFFLFSQLGNPAPLVLFQNDLTRDSYELGYSNRALTLDPLVLFELEAQKDIGSLVRIPNFNPDEQDWILQLQNSTISSSNGFLVTLESGEEYRVTDGLTMTGQILGEDGSYAAVSVFRGIVSIHIQTSDIVHYTISQESNETEYKIYKSKESLSSIAQSFNCNIEIADLKQKGSKNPIRATVGGASVGVMLEYDFDSFESDGNLNTSIAYLQAIFMGVQTIFDRLDDGPGGRCIPMHLSQLIIWNIPDPYFGDNSNQSIQQLSEFALWRQLHPWQGDVAHLIRNVDGTGHGGLATRDDGQICNDEVGGDRGPYSVSYHNGATSAVYYPTAIVAHEIGHVINGKHTHECHWGPNGDQAIENFCIPQGCTTNGVQCNQSNLVINPGFSQATLMSYCWSTPNNNCDFDLSFVNPIHTVVADDMLQHYNDVLADPNCDLHQQCNNDQDHDGICAVDDCDDNNIEVGAIGIVGDACDDGDPSTFDDVYQPDNTQLNNMSCICEGNPYSNDNDPNSSSCNLILGGTMDFENMPVGNQNGTAINGMITRWTGITSTPDIANDMEGVVCNRFIQLLGRSNADTYDGFGIPLQSPIPPGQSATLSFSYSIFDDALFRDSEIMIQGSPFHDNSRDMPLSTDYLFNQNIIGDMFLMERVNLGGTALHHQNEVALYSHISLNPNNCPNNATFSNIIDVSIDNPSTTENVNFIYISYDVAGYNIPNTFDFSLLELDNISLVLVGNAGYSPPTVQQLNSCDYQVSPDIRCEYAIQNQLPNGDWENIFTSDNPGVINNHSLSNCGAHRIVQVCPPFNCGSDIWACDPENNCITFIEPINNNCITACVALTPTVQNCVFTANIDGTFCDLDSDNIQWFDDNGALVHEGAEFMPNENGTYSYAIESNNNCGTYSSPLFTVDCFCSDNPSISLSSSSPSCGPIELTITGMTNSFLANWFRDGNFLGSAVSWTADVSGIYTAGIFSFGCAYATNPVNIEITTCDLEFPTVNGCDLSASFPDCIGGTLLDWRYSPDGGTTPWVTVSTSSNFTADMDGSYFYRVSAPNGCGTFSSSVVQVNGCENPQPQECCGFVADFIIDLNGSYLISSYTQFAQHLPLSAPTYWRFEGKNICIIGDVNDDFHIDEHVSFLNCNIRIEEGINIITDGGDLTTGGNTSFDNCGSGEWGGLIAESGFYLGLNPNTVVSNATDGVEIKDGAQVHIEGTTFRDGKTAIFIDGNFENWGLRGNTFTNMRNVGINASNDLSIFTYPTTNSGQFINQAPSRSPGVLSTFVNCETGIDYTRASGILRIAGCEMTNVETGIFTSAPNVQMQYTNIDASNRGIDFSGTTSNLSFYTCNFRNCSEFGIEDLGKDYTFLDDVNFTNVTNPIVGDILSPMAIQGVQRPWIRGCDFWNCTGTMINIEELQGNSIFEIWNNRVHSFDGSNINGEFPAFYINQGQNVSITGNEFNSDNDEVGIFLLDGASNSLRENIMDGNGILLDGESSPFLCSNEISNASKYGINLSDVDRMSGDASLISNVFNGTSDGLLLSGTMIGTQEHHENCWNSSGAKSTDASWESSTFIYDDAIDCYLPDPLEPSQSGNSSDWFQPDNTSSGTPDCDTEDPNMLAGGDGNEVDDDCGCQGAYDCYPEPCCTIVHLPTCEELLEFFGGSTSMTRGQAWDVYQAISDWWDAFAAANGLTDPIPPSLTSCWEEIHEEGNPEGEGGNSVDNDVLSTLIHQAQALRQLDEAQSYTKEESSGIGLLLYETDSLINELDLLDSRTQQAQISQLYDEIEARNVHLDLIKQAYQQRKEDLASDILTIVSQLDNSYGFVYHKNNMLRIEAKLLTMGHEQLTNPEWTDIIAAAQSCAYMTGHAAYVARSIYHKVGGPHPVEYDDSQLCQNVDQRELDAPLANNELIKIYPNPVSGILNIDLDQQLEFHNELKIEVYNALGHEIYSHDLTNGQLRLEIDVSHFMDGVHLVKVSDNEEPLIIQRVLVLN